MKGCIGKAKKGTRKGKWKKKTIWSLWLPVWVPIFLLTMMVEAKFMVSYFDQKRTNSGQVYKKNAEFMSDIIVPETEELQNIKYDANGAKQEEQELIDKFNMYLPQADIFLYMVLTDKDGAILAQSHSSSDDVWYNQDKEYIEEFLAGKEPEGRIWESGSYSGSSDGNGIYGIYKQGIIGLEFRYEHQFYMGGKTYTILMAKRDRIESYDKQFIAKNLTIGTVFSIVFSFLLAFYFYRIYKKELSLQKQQRDFSNSLAHDLKTPLMAISGYAENLAENICVEKTEHYIKGIQSNVTYMDHLVGQMLDLAKTGQAAAELKKETLHLCPLVEKLFAQYQVLIEEKKLWVTIEGEACIQADEGKMERVLENLLRNAITYSPKGSKIIVKMDEKHFEMKNTGVTIAKEDLKEIWNPFVTGEKSRKKGSGHGLGLAIVANILDQHGFAYEIKSEHESVCVTIYFS